MRNLLDRLNAVSLHETDAVELPQAAAPHPGLVLRAALEQLGLHFGEESRKVWRNHSNDPAAPLSEHGYVELTVEFDRKTVDPVQLLDRIAEAAGATMAVKFDGHSRHNLEHNKHVDFMVGDEKIGEGAAHFVHYAPYREHPDTGSYLHVRYPLGVTGNTAPSPFG